MSRKESFIRDKDTKTAVFTFGRFQPPTIGHGVLVYEVAKQALIEGGDPYIFVSRSCNKGYIGSRQYKSMYDRNVFESCDANKNPLTSTQKTFYMKKMFPEVRVIDTEVENTPVLSDCIQKLKDKGYTRLIMVVGSDRIAPFKFVLAEGVEKVIPAGEKRDSRAVGLKGMSGTKMRIAAVSGDYETFKNGVMIGKMTEDLVKQMMNDVRIALGYPAITFGGMKQIFYNILNLYPKCTYKKRRGGYKLEDDER